MNEQWQALIRFAIYVSLIVGALAYLSKAFGGHIIRDITGSFPREFTTKMGVFSFIGFLVIAYFTFDQALFGHLASLIEPANGGGHGAIHHNERHVEILVGALIISLLGNFIIIAWVSRHHP
jgi:hypothetical protein